MTSVEFQKIASSWASNEYWVGKFSQQLGHRPQSHAEEEVEAALLDGASQKFVAQIDGEIVGAISYQMSVDSNEVTATHLGSTVTGIGSQLIKKAMSYASRMKVPLRLQSSNEAVGFYAKLGFEDEGKNVFVWYPPSVKSLVHEAVKEILLSL